MKNNFRVILAKQRKKTSDVAEATGISKTTLTILYYERKKKLINLTKKRRKKHGRHNKNASKHDFNCT